MISLTKAKIINWHYFWNQTVDFKQISFLTGKNGSGKSTLIDAIELVLLGDTTGRYFNKAAMEKSARTLKGYLRGEIGDDSSSEYRYLRNGKFTSYIALEFHDDVNTKDFVMGIVFDTESDGSEEHHFFSLDDKIPENEFVLNNYPMEFKTLSNFFSENYPHKYHFFDSNAAYRDFLKKKFGGIKDKYFTLLKKASSFSPITDITTFITEYVCDPQADITLDSLKSNIKNYKALQKEAEVYQRRVDRLEEIKKTFEAFNSQRNALLINQYIVERSELEISKEKLETFKNQIQKDKERIKQIEEEIIENNLSLEELDARKVKLISDRANNDTLRLTNELKEDRNDTIKKINVINEDNRVVRDNLFNYTSNYFKASENLIQKLENFNKSYLDEDRAKELDDLIHLAKDIKDKSINIKENYLNDLMSLDKEVLDNYRDSLSEFKAHVGSLATTLAKNITSLDRKIENLRHDELELKSGKGKKPYDPQLLIVKERLKEELKRKFNKDIDVEIYADLVDINDLSWSNAIEAFLYNQKFNLFVAPKYYLDAYKFLKEILSELNYYRTSLVDQEKLIERNFNCEPNSLAEEILTSHEGARAYSNFLIGRLHKSSSIEECRNSGNGITKDVDLYRNFSLTRLNPRLYQFSFIGRTIDERFIKEKSLAITNLIANKGNYKALYDVITDANALEVINTNEISNILAVISKTSELKGLQNHLDYLNEQLSEHDTTLIDSLDKRIEDIDFDINELKKRNENLLLEKGTLTNDIKTLTNEKTKDENMRILEKEKYISLNFDSEFINNYCLDELEKAKEKHSSYIKIKQEYGAMATASTYKVNTIFTNLKKLRRDYTSDFHLSYNIEAIDNIEFDNELIDFKEVRLPAYKVKIDDSYTKAVQQFKDDFINKLRNAINDAEDQIANLNSALKDSTFGSDIYRFDVRPSTVYRRYYDMLKDDIVLNNAENEDLFLEKYKDVMEDLFRQITDNDGKESELNRNIQKFTDYRSYLDFDLMVKDKVTNREISLNKVIKMKSGGETQTPFYISVLASFAQLYRVNSDEIASNTIRIIIFDEAFSKMDRERIVESVRLLKQFKLQVILSTPPEKIGDIASEVDETIVVSNDKNASCAISYSKREIDDIKIN